jgi:UDP-N-acetyl-D-glucosamine dehydrogenase
VGDIRESPSISVSRILDRRGARIMFHDPHVDAISINGRHLDRIDLTQRAFTSADCVALLTAHRLYDLDWIGANAQLVFDARNAFAGRKIPSIVRL